jgi:uncharacterized protein (TIGR03083 family)
MSTGHDRVEKLITTLNAAWDEFRDAYAGLSDDELLEPGVTGEWSVRDLIAHITWWEEESLKHLPLILDGGRPERYSVRYGGIDAFNAVMTRQRQDLCLEDVRREFEDTHRRLVMYIRSVPPEAFVGDTRARRRLRLDTYGHYPIHTQDIRAWRERRG